MPTVALLNQTGAKVKDITLADAVFGIEPNQDIIELHAKNNVLQTFLSYLHIITQSYIGTTIAWQ